VVPDLPGCFSAGDTIGEAIRNAHETIDGFCAALAEDGGDLPKARPMSERQKDPQFKGSSAAMAREPVCFGQDPGMRAAG
jgi:predicted RNase H-like HicB family nuclease